MLIGDDDDDFVNRIFPPSLLPFSFSLKTMQDHQSYMRRRESDHRAVSEITNERVWKWTVAEAVVLVALSVYQIMYLRSFFETKKRL